MSFGGPWRPFEEIIENPWKFAEAWKEKTGRKVVGHLLPDVPEEIIHAAGALPVGIAGGGIQISRALEYIPGYTCSHAMGAVELGLLGRLRVLDGMVIPYVCDTTRNLYHIWARCFPDLANEFLRLPKRLDYSGARDYLHEEFSRLFRWVRQVTGSEAGGEELRSSVALYDKSRAALRRAYRKQQEDPGIWTSEMVQLLFASALMCPREEHLAWMEELPWNEKTPDSRQRVPVYVRGKVWDPPGILDMFDRIGLLVVGDEMVTGLRWVSVDAGESSDPVAALVNRYFTMIPYAGYHREPARIVSDFMDRVHASGARGVLFLNPKFCEAAAFDTPDLQRALEEAAIPSLVLETSTRGISMGQVSLRLEAFKEMIAGDLIT